MTITYTEAYRTAFVEYLRRGTPIGLWLKQAGITDQYVWRTRRDERVRPSRRMNDGRIFSWSDPPATGHPGDDYNCRCEALPFVAGETEFGFHEFTTSLASSYDRWTKRDFIRHYYNGGGRAVTLLEIGNLREVAEQYAYGGGTERAFRRLADQIADAARASGVSALSYDFGHRTISVMSHSRMATVWFMMHLALCRHDPLLSHRQCRDSPSGLTSAGHGP